MSKKSKQKKLNTQTSYFQAAFVSAAILLFFYFAFDISARFLLSSSTSIPIGILLWGFFMWKYAKRPYLEQVKKYAFVFFLFFSSCFVFINYGPLLQAKWGPIDDHEIMRYLGQDGKMDYAELSRFLPESEAMKPGKLLRYRPSYQILRLIESASWDNHPGAWYATRLIILTFSLAIFAYLSYKLVGILPSILLSLYTMTFSLWPDIFARLGPSETYAVLATAVFALSYYCVLKNLLSKEKNNPWIDALSWWSLTVSYIVSLGAKENMLVLLLPLIFLFFVAFYKKKINANVLLHLVMTMSFSVFMTWAIWSAISKAGHDVYEQSVAADSRLRIALRTVKTLEARYPLSLLISSLGLSLFASQNNWKKLQKKALLVAGISIALLVLLMSQYVFYNGAWPNYNRYDFPGILHRSLVFLLAFYLIKELLAKLKIAKLTKSAVHWSVYFGFAAIIIMKGYVPAGAKIKATVEQTNVYTASITGIANKAAICPECPIVVESHSVWDYEPIYSVGVFLRAHKVENPLMLRIHDYDESTVNQGLESSLARELKKTSQYGNSYYSALSELDIAEKCFSLQLSGNTQTECQNL